MIYLVKLKRYHDDTIAIKEKRELPHIHLKAYHEYVKDVFIENQMNYGQDEQEAVDAFHDQPFETIEKHLLKSGFDLENDFKYISGGKII